MIVCFPAAKDEGAASPVHNHLGSAPLFIIVDAATGEVLETVVRGGGCGHGGPVADIRGRGVGAVVTGGIGPGALNGLSAQGIRALRPGAPTIAENLKLLAEDRLEAWEAVTGCSGHAPGGHSHGVGGGCGCH